MASSDKQPDEIKIPDTERKRREAVWELFKSECVFLIDHLMVLKHVSVYCHEISHNGISFPMLVWLEWSIITILEKYFI